MPIAPKPLPPLAVLREMFRYDPDTGAIWNLVSRTRRRSGERAESVDAAGYFTVSVRGAVLKAARVAWYLHYGKEPTAFVDHIDGNKQNNRILNLRDATHILNTYNRAVASHSKSRIKGVHRRKDNGLWRAYISANGKRVSLGQYKTKTDAADALRKQRNNFHGEYSRD